MFGCEVIQLQRHYKTLQCSVFHLLVRRLCVSVSVVSCVAQCLDFYFLHSVPRKSSGTIDVIGGQTATISRVEGRRRHNLDGNNIQVHRSKTGCWTGASV